MKKQVFGAILLSAALAVGTAMPAFAAGTVTDTENKQGDISAGSETTISSVAGEAGETTVNISTIVTQINVTVPLTVGFYAETAGGTLGVPSDGTYFIENGGPSPIYVVKMELSAVNDQNWKAASSSSASNFFTTAADAKYGNIYAAMKYDITSSGSTQSVMTYPRNEVVIKDYNSGQIEIPEKNGTNNGKFGINFEGANGVLKESMTGSEELFKVTYTVSVNPKHGASN